MHELHRLVRLLSFLRGGPLALSLAALGCAASPAQRADVPQTSAAGSSPGAPAEAQPSAPSSRSPEPNSPDDGESQPATPPEPAPGASVELRHARARTPWLGVELRATDPDKAGVQIARVLPGSPAATAQLQAGDILLRLGEHTATSPADVANWVRAQELGSSQPFSIKRGNQTHLIRAQLDGLPEFEDRLRLAFVGRQAPEISGVVTFQGEAASLKELKGQVVVLEFWASFCGVCRFLAPVLDGWQRKYAPQGAQIVGITPDPPQKGMEVARQTGMTYTLASDPQAKITRDYMASQIPTVLILDRRGIVHDVIVGYSKARLAEAEDLIQELLDQSP